MRKLFLFSLLLLGAASLSTQTVPVYGNGITYTYNDPGAGSACAAGSQNVQVISTGVLYACSSTGVYTVVGGGGTVTWPATADIVLSNSTNAPAGLAPVNGDCVVGAGGAWTAGACPGGSSAGAEYAAQVVGSTSGSFADSGAKLASDSQNNYTLNRTIYSWWPLPSGADDNYFGPGAMSSAFVGTGPSGQSFSNYVWGVGALANAQTISETVAIGTDVLNSWISSSGTGPVGGNEDGVMTCVGSAACNFAVTGHEVVALGHWAYAFGTGEANSVLIGTHNLFEGGGASNTYVGDGITGSFANTASTNTSFAGGQHNVILGSNIFSGPTGLTPNTTYAENYNTIVGSGAGGCWFDGTSFNVLIGPFVGTPLFSSSSSSTYPCTSARSNTGNVIISTAAGSVVPAGASMTAASDNVIITGVGYGPPNANGGVSITSGSGNTLLGAGTGAAITTAVNDVFVGNNSGAAATAVDITAVGAFSLYALTSGTGDSGFGYGACELLTAETNNTCVGNGAEVVAGANGAVAVGTGASAKNDGVAVGVGISDTGGQNTLLGWGVSSSGQYSVAIGIVAETTANDGVALGSYAHATAQDAVEVNTTGGVLTNGTQHSFQWDSLPLASTAAFSVSGCGTAGSLTGSGLAGTFTAGATSCTPVITTGVTALHGFVCQMSDWTTPADALKQASANTTTATFGAATVVSGDTLAFTCAAY